MDPKTIISSLRHMKPPVKKLPDWQMTPGLINALLMDPKASADYIHERMTRLYESKSEIGDHNRAFQGASGMTQAQLTELHSALGLAVRMTQNKKRRIDTAKKTRARRLAIAQAITEYICGYASCLTLAERLGVSYNTMLREAGRGLRLEGKTVRDLPKLSTPERRALALKIEGATRRMLAERYEKYIPE